jgi:cysteine-rich repeat protein
MSFDPATTDPNPTQQAIVDACKENLEPDKVYEVAIFHAERHTGASNFSLTLDGFITSSSSCDWTCGDGVATRFEFCDDGAAENTGAYGHCMPTCQALGPHCGDGTVDEGFEECDDGENLGVSTGCNPDCTEAASCGDGVRQPELGEECDAGSQNGEPGSTCSEDCKIEVQ